MTQEGPEDQTSAEHPTCYRHPERETYIRCQRCDRYICPDCQRTAAVGFQCVECVRAGARDMPTVRTRFGGVLRPDGGVITKVLIGINVAVFVLVQVVGSGLGQDLALIGRAIMPDGTLGGVADGEYWRLLTSAFLHVQLLHLGVNLFALWVLGPPLETALGRLRFAALYLLSGLGGSAVAYAFSAPNLMVVGASGAIAGLFGATLVLARVLRWNLSFLIVILGLNVMLNIWARDMLSWQGHLGGLAAGLVIGAAFRYAPRERRDLIQGIGFAAVTIATIGLIIWQTMSLNSGPF